MVGGGRPALHLAEVPWKNGEFDVGVEWPEHRAIDKIVVRFEGEPVRHDKCYLERWDGLSPLQGSWKPLEVMEPWQRGGDDLQGLTWTLNFPSLRTTKVRLRVREQKQTAVRGFEVYGPSRWKSGEIRIEWRYLDAEKSYDGRIETYNGETLQIRPLDNTRLKGPREWNSTAGNGGVGGLQLNLLYTAGMDTDRTIVTIRNRAADFSFLPREAIEEQPIDIPDFGVYACGTSTNLSRDAYRRQSAERFRIIDAVAKHPEQTLESAYAQIGATRVVAFVGVDCNSQKFGVAPAGHVTVGYGDPSFGRAEMPQFVVNFDTLAEPVADQESTNPQPNIFKEAKDKQQELAKGWLPIITTIWGEKSEVSYTRTDYAVLASPPETLDESNLTGDEPALLISRLVIRNESPLPKRIHYYVKAWKRQVGEWGYPAMPANSENPWETTLAADCAMVNDGETTSAICYIDTQGRGSLSHQTRLGAIRYTVELGANQQHAIHTVIPGRPWAVAESAKLKGLAYERLYDSTVQYWEGRLQEGMQVELPEPHLQNLYNATQQHFLVSFTKDPKRSEYYPNGAILIYGPDPFDSSPIMQALDVRGMHKLAEKCLQAYLSTQGDSQPDGDYPFKEGGFYEYWPQDSSNQGFILWALAEHYLYTRNQEWLTKVAPQIVAGCDFIIRARKRTMQERPGGGKPLTYGLAPAGTLGDPRSWQYTFTMNGLFYLGMKKCAQALQDVDPENAKRIAADAADYLEAIRHTLKELMAQSPVTRLRDNTSVPCVPPFVTLRGFTSDVHDSVDPDARFAYASDVTAGAFQLVKCEVIGANDPPATWLLNTFEDRFFLYSPHRTERVHLDNIGIDWFNLGGFDKMQPYILYYPEAYLRRDQIPNFVRGFYNTLASMADPQNLCFQEELGGGGGQPEKAGEEAKFLMQLRQMLLIEIGDELHLARGTPRRWLADGNQIALRRAPSYFGEVNYRIQSFTKHGRIEANVTPPARNRPANLYLRLRHPEHATMKTVMVDGRAWKDFDPSKEWIKLPTDAANLRVVAYY